MPPLRGNSCSAVQGHEHLPPHSVGADIEPGQELSHDSLLLVEQPQQQVLRVNVAMTEFGRIAECAIERFLDGRGEFRRGKATMPARVSAADDVFDQPSNH